MDILNSYQKKGPSYSDFTDTDVILLLEILLSIMSDKRHSV